MCSPVSNYTRFLVWVWGKVAVTKNVPSASCGVTQRDWHNPGSKFPNSKWILKLTCLSNIFAEISNLNTSMQEDCVQTDTGPRGGWELWKESWNCGRGKWKTVRFSPSQELNISSGCWISFRKNIMEHVEEPTLDYDSWNPNEVTKDQCTDHLTFTLKIRRMALEELLTFMSSLWRSWTTIQCPAISQTTADFILGPTKTQFKKKKFCEVLVWKFCCPGL